MAHAATGEAYKPGMEGRDGLRQVLAKPVSLESVVGEEAHHVHVNAVFFQRRQHESYLTLHCFLVNDQRQSIALPALTLNLYLLFCKHLALVVDETHEQLILMSILATGKDREVELLKRLRLHAPPPRIIECVLFGQEHIMRIVCAQGISRADTDRMIALPCRRSIPTMMIAGRILEVTVLNKFGIETAVGRIADVLKENAHQTVADRFLLRRIYGQRRL